MRSRSETPPPEALAAWLPRQRWFGAKARRITGVERLDEVPLAGAALAVLGVSFDDGGTDRYAVPLLAGDEPIDALDDPAFCRALLELIVTGGRATGRRGVITGARTSALPSGLAVAGVTARRIGAEQSNSSLVYGDALILKHFRRLVGGENPDVEITRFLTERVRFPYTPRLLGWLDYGDSAGARATLGVAQELVPDAVDGWRWMLERLAAFVGQATADRAPRDDRVQRLARESLRAVRRLAETTAALHLNLALEARCRPGHATPEDAAFEPEVITRATLAAWAQSVLRQIDGARAIVPDVPAVAEADVAAALAGLQGRAKTRHHGDYHLGQTLYRPSREDFMIIDFEGEPLRPLEERRGRHSPLRDVAGMLRSIDYAAASTPGAPAWVEAWRRLARAAFLGSYVETAMPAAFLPDWRELDAAVAAFELEKAAYEVVYEANNRPDWLPIPLRGLAGAAARLSGSAAGAA
ncbi:MAG: hypothetical protein HY294_13310 [Candidatus Rokubacteria bacterium]|nr:hypothetical protein [Candidatus Rokubacteria bacterium]MBI3826968.1 hypothetical protein [Candidatus Rokubacteria bacterium]